MPHSLKLLKEASESVHLHYISCYSTLFSSSCPAGFLYLTANLYRQPNWVFSRSHNRFEWSVHIELTALCVGWGMSSPRQANQSSFFSFWLIRASLQCHPSIFPQSTRLYSLFHFLHSHIFLFRSLHPPIPSISPFFVTLPIFLAFLASGSSGQTVQGAC